MLRIRKKILTIMAASCTIVVLNVFGIKADALEKTTSQNYVEAMEPGWNLGNTFESVDTWSDRTNPNWVDQEERTWGNPTPTKELIDAVKASGFKSIRMPFTAYTRIGDAPGYKVRQDYVDKYASIVKYALDQDLYVIADMNHGDWFTWAHKIGTDDGTALNEYKVIWKQFAEYFKDYPDKLLFEASNEPTFDKANKADNIKINNEVNNAFREVVRATGGNNSTRMLIFPNLNTNAEEAETISNAQNIASLNDTNIIATFHYYGYWPFSVNIAGKPKFDSEVQNYAKSAIDLMYDYFTSKGVGVLGGEYSVLGEGTINNGEYLKYMDYVTAYAKEKGITMMLWDAGYHMDRYSYNWKDQDVIDTIMTSVNGGRSSSTDGDTLYVNGKTRNTGVSTKVNLNGNKLDSIIDADNNTLVPGADYIIEDDLLTFKTSYLKKIIDSTYGTCASLSLKFSNGPVWKMNINYYKMPVSGDATGTNNGLDIPMQFNGIKLSTMEAIVEGSDINGNPGQGVGPNNWTTYKAFKDTFEPDYVNNKVVIKNAFFKECSDGNVVLKFHWEEGTITTYKINKTGNTITGTAINLEDTTIGPKLGSGDVNGDGKINILDYSALRMYVNKKGEGRKINTENADLNGDEKINFIDLAILRSML